MRKPSGKINIKIEFFSLLQIQKEWIFFFQWTDSGKNMQQVVIFSNPILKFPSHWFKINKRQLKIDGIKVFDVQR